VEIYDVVELDRLLEGALLRGRLDELVPALRRASLDLAVACNVLALSPGERILRGSEIERRMRARIDELELELRELELESSEAA
jgi:hypothetical protein